MQQQAQPQMIAGNWKMNGSFAGLGDFAASVRAATTPAELLICPPFPLIRPLIEAFGGAVAVGAQDCGIERAGAHTGDVSPDLLAELGASHVILGHSERRTDHGETSVLVHRKTEAAIAAGLIPIVCVGETEAERDGGEAENVVRAQLAASLPKNFAEARGIVAYEPVWAIGTGRTPSNDDIASMHATIRTSLGRQLGEAGGSVRILYGGSVKPANAAEILAIQDVGGALVGGASLKASDLLAIAAASRSV